MNGIKTLVICCAVILAAAAALTLIYTTEPTAQRTSAVRQSAMRVDVIEVEAGTFTPTLAAVGSVRPEQEIVLGSRVNGEIVSLADEFTPGGFVSKGDLLLQVDPTDYETALIEANSQLHQAQADLELELGRQELARGDYEDLKGTISAEYETLVLRQPQLNSARASVEAAEAAVRRAEVDLERTRIRAPFAAQVLSREVNIGSQVSPGQTLGRLVGTDRYWIEVALPASDVQWIDVPGAGRSKGSPARVRNRTAWPEGQYREGGVISLIGALDGQTRMARVLVSVADPLAQSPGSEGEPPLMVGAFVEVSIDGRPISNVVRLDQEYLRRDGTVWVKKDGRLDVRKVEVAFMDKDHAYIRNGLQTGEQVVTTDLATVIDGAELRLSGGEAPQ